MTEDESTQSSLSAYLGQKGAVELLCEIEPNGSRYTSLVEELSISRATVSSRLKEGERLGLFQREEVKGRGTSHAYQLTEVGANIRLYLDHSGLTERHRTIKELQRDFDERVEELRGWMQDNEEEMRSSAEGTDLRHHLRKYSTIESR